MPRRFRPYHPDHPPGRKSPCGAPFTYASGAANAVGFDLAVPGNHEFDFGPEVLQERLAESNATWLLGNVDYGGRRGFPGTRATALIEKDGYKLGFLGLLTPVTAEISAATGVEVGGAPLEPGRVYRVATNDFMYTGGDGYTAFQSAEVLVDAASGDTMANHVIDYVRAAGSAAPVVEGRIIRED